MENDYRIKTGPEYDAIRANLLMHYQDRVWEMVKHVSTIELATFVGWYYLFDDESYILSLGLIMITSLFVWVLIKSIDRYTYLGSCASQSLNKGCGIYLYCVPGKHVKGRGYRGYKIARQLPLAALSVNFLAFIASMSFIVIDYCG